MPQLRVAILGGGLAGAILFRSLLPLKHLKVDIFESRSAFKEEGIAIGMARNGLRALKAIDPELLDCLERAGAVTESEMRAFIATGPDFEKIYHMETSKDGDDLVRSVARAPFLSEILASVPENAMHTNKRMVDIERSEDDTYTLHFEDGTQQDFDIIFGADGIHSSVRKYVLGDENPYTKAVGAGWWFYFVFAPMEDAKTVLSDYHLDKPRQQIFTGRGNFTLAGWANDGKSIWGACGARMDDGFDRDAWKIDMTEEQFHKHFEEDSEMCRKLAALLRKNAPPDAAPFCMFHHPQTPTYIKGHVAIVGDAAHAPCPWQGSGGGMSAEDAAVISTLLAHISTKEEIPAALQAYDRTRRPRCQAVVDSSYDAGLMLTGVKEGVGLDVEKLRKEMKHKWEHILPYDVEAARKEALDAMAELAKK